MKGPKNVRMIKLADRLHNLRSMKTGGKRWTRKKIAEYLKGTRDDIMPVARITDLWFIAIYKKFGC